MKVPVDAGGERLNDILCCCKNEWWKRVPVSRRHGTKDLANAFVRLESNLIAKECSMFENHVIGTNEALGGVIVFITLIHAVIIK